MYRCNLQVACLALVALVSGAFAQVEICTHEYFDIATLKSQEQWHATTPDPAYCAEGNGATSCTVYFAACGPLPPNVCNNGNQTGFCQIVIDANIDHRYDTGKLDLIIYEANGTDGFQLKYMNGQSTSECNASTTTTIVFFQCDITAEWNIHNNDVTQYLDVFAGDPLDECVFLMVLNYSGACIAQKPIYPDLCDVQYYDVQTLTHPDFWIATVPAKDCATGVSGATCDLLFSFCKTHPASGQCYDSVFCQRGENPTSFGSYNKNLNIVEDIDGLGFTISYYNGTKTTDCPDGYHSTLVFVCDSSAIWDASDIINNNITRFVQAEPVFKDCEYIVRFNYSGACSEITPLPPAGPGLEPASPVGFILMGIFLAIALAYFAVGAVVQLVRGKRGVQIVPNYEFWKNFFILVVEGSQFLLDVVTCFTISKTSSTKKIDYEKL